MIPLALVALVTPAVPADILALQKEYEHFWGVSVTLRTKRCEEENAWYTFDDKSVTLCDELLDRPALARWVFRHEMGHAINDQFHIAWVDPEAAADELAMITASPEESLAAMLWFSGSALVEGGDPHPAALDRATAIACYIDGSDPRPADRKCAVYARSVFFAWERLLITMSGVDE